MSYDDCYDREMAELERELLAGEITETEYKNYANEMDRRLE